METQTISLGHDGVLTISDNVVQYFSGAAKLSAASPCVSPETNEIRTPAAVDLYGSASLTARSLGNVNGENIAAVTSAYNSTPWFVQNPTLDTVSQNSNSLQAPQPVALHKPTIILDRIVYIRHPVKVTVTVQKEWRLHHGLTETSLFDAVTACKAFAYGSSSMTEIKCYSCSTDTGKVISVSALEKVPRVDSKTGREKYLFLLTSLCKSSRDHLSSDLNMLVSFPNCAGSSISTPFSLRSRAPCKYSSSSATSPSSPLSKLSPVSPKASPPWLERFSCLPPIIVRLCVWHMPRTSVDKLVCLSFCNAGQDLASSGALAVQHVIIDNNCQSDTFIVMATTYDTIEKARNGPKLFMEWVRTPSKNCIGVDPVSTYLLGFLATFESF
ncbi:hypothetical protein Pelo_16416 [Pelomyxa schiedti]|nr:hypothetical protein Pelo_16416 [Pelomyxa schiedti]